MEDNYKRLRVDYPNANTASATISLQPLYNNVLAAATVFFLTLSIVLLSGMRPLFANSLLLATYELPPYVMLQNGQVKGTVSNKVRAICDKANFDCIFRFLPRLEAEWQARRGDVDGVFPLEWTQERATSLLFSPPLAKVSFAVLRKQTAFRRNNVQQLGVDKHSSAFYLAKNWLFQSRANIQLTAYPSLLAALQSLHYGELQLVYANKQQADFIVSQYPHLAFVTDRTDKKLHYHLAFSNRKVAPATHKRFNRGYWQTLAFSSRESTGV